VASSRLVSSFKNHPIHGVAMCIWVITWILATMFGWVYSVVFVSHVSMATAVYTSVAAWRADVPNKEEDE
jgi:ABC-type transport system involved in Fe-S cluster assembly fused permease/ATPase subunit